MSETDSPASPTSPVRIQRCFTWTSLSVATVAAADVTLYAVAGNSIRGVDYLVLIVAAALWILYVRRRALLGRLSISMVAVLLCLAGFEAAMSLVSLQAQRSWPWYVWPPGYVCKTNAHGLPGVAAEGTFSINRQGLRGPEMSESDRYRILCVGGSTTECLYVDDSKAWPHLLQQQLAKATPDVWVGNAGRSGTTALDHVTLLEHLPEARMVDCWVVLCGVNDMGLQIHGTYAAEARQTFRRNFTYRRPGIVWPLRRPLHRNLFTFDVLESWRHRLQVMLKNESFTVYQDVQAVWVDEMREHRQRGTKTDAVPPLEPLLAEYRRQLKRLVNLSRQRGVRLVFATQPTWWSEEMPPQLEALSLGGRLTDGRYLSNRARHRLMSAYNQTMRRLCESEGVELVDLARQLPKSTDAFYDDVHFNEPGCRKVARHLARHLAGPRIAAKAPWAQRR